MTKCYCLPICFLASIFISYKGNSQPTNDDSAFYNNSIQNIKSLYFSAVKEKAHINNGLAYEVYGHGSIGSPFFMADTMIKGAVMYDGYLYQDVPLKYDMVKDELLTTYFYDSNVVMQLVKAKVNYFSISGHTFISLNKSDQISDVLSGFCELLYNDKKTMVLAKRDKKFKLSARAEDQTSSFIQYNQYFVLKDDKNFLINSESDLLKMYGDKAQEVKNYMRSRKVKYKRNAEQAIVTATTFYNGLTK